MTEETKRVIRCTPENAKEMAAAVKAWPELHALVQSLQASNLFPGLRALQITLSGDQTFTGKGLVGITDKTAKKAQ